MKLIIEKDGKQILSVALKYIAFLFLLFYFFWETYWYFQAGLTFIKWHTHLMFPVYIFALIYGILKIFKAKDKAIGITAQIFTGIFLTELLLLITGLTKTKHEQNYGYYDSGYKMTTDRAYYWIDKPFSTKYLSDQEFNYTRQTNSLGYSDNEWTVKKDSNELRVLCLGDSFTEGDGADEDSSYVSFLRKTLRTEMSCPVTVMNAGKCGSDPFFNYMNYKDQLSRFFPDIVIQTISTHDLVDDIYLRGGFERFGKNYTISFRKNLTIEALYALSYTGRILFKVLGYNELIINKEKYEHTYKQDQKAILDLFSKYFDLTEKHNAKLIIVLLPNQYEIENNYPFYFKEIKDSLSSKKFIVYDLKEHYNEHLKSTQTKIQQYFWIRNGHHNAKGYEMMANGISQAIYKIKKDKCVK